MSVFRSLQDIFVAPGSSYAASVAKPRLLYPLAIRGSGSVVPPTVLTSAEIDRLVGKPLGWAQKTTGIAQRHVVTTESVIDLAVAAARRALDDAGMKASEIDCIIAAGALAHQPIPTSAILIQKALGLGSSGIPVFDINATCLSYLAALDTAGAFLAAGRYRNILVTAADMPSRGTNWHEPELKAMFGDGAAATILSRTTHEDQGVLAVRMESYSEGSDACVLRAGGTGLDPQADPATFMAGIWFEMDGPLAYRISARYMSDFFHRLLQDAGVTLREIDIVIPHQASAHALHLMRKRLKVPTEKLIDQLAWRGNQVSASIPSMLDHARATGLAQPGSLALLIGTAAGITLGGAVVRL